MKRLFTFLRLIDDHDGNISLTNVALLIVLTKLALTQNASLIDAGSLLITLLSYQGKKLINKDAGVVISTPTEDAIGILVKRVDELSNKVSAQQIGMGIKSLK